MTTGACESCGATPAELEPVHRVYVRTGPDGTVDAVQVLPEPERWCLACRTLYPHELPSPGSPEP